MTSLLSVIMGEPDDGPPRATHAKTSTNRAEWMRLLAQGGFALLNEEDDEATIQTLSVAGADLRRAEAEGLVYFDHKCCKDRSQWAATLAGKARYGKRSPGQMVEDSQDQPRVPRRKRGSPPA